MIFKQYSAVFNIEYDLDYTEGICTYCNKPCHKIAYAHNECTQKEIRKINLALKLKEKAVMK